MPDTKLSAECIEKKKETAVEILTDLTIYCIENWTKNQIKTQCDN